MNTKVKKTNYETLNYDVQVAYAKYIGGRDVPWADLLNVNVKAIKSPRVRITLTIQHNDGTVLKMTFAERFDDLECQEDIWERIIKAIDRTPITIVKR